MRIGRIAPLLVASLIAASLATPAAASSKDEEVARFYKGKQITMVIGSSSGGGYDLYGRLVARHIGKYIPGNPTVVPSNMIGAASLVAAQYIYNIGPKDGTAIGAIYPQIVLEQLLGDKTNAKLDPRKLKYLGSANSEVYICMVRADSPVKTLDDAANAVVIMGATAPGASSYDFPLLLNKVLGTKFRIVSGYPGNQQIALALEKGEIDGTCGTGWSTLASARPHWLREGFIRVIAQEGLKGSPELDVMQVPLAISYAKTPEQRQIMEIVYSQLLFGRPFVVAPEVPAERLASLQAAFMSALRDPELLAEARKLNLEIVAMPGSDVKAMVERLFSTPPEIVERARQVLQPAGKQ
jgi:tripartite-type tricarboxylate transporter receptor subunit TctC